MRLLVGVRQVVDGFHLEKMGQYSTDDVPRCPCGFLTVSRDHAVGDAISEAKGTSDADGRYPNLLIRYRLGKSANLK